jgi:hypothetical protein
LDVAQSGVSARDEVGTPSGSVSGDVEKLVMRRAAKSLAGPQGLADDLEVKLVEANHATDADLAAAAVEAIEILTTVPTEALRITARKGWLKFGGRGGWETSARHCRGRDATFGGSERGD